MLNTRKVLRRSTSDGLPIAKTQALELLRSPDFFCHALDAIKKGGLVGEEVNALALFIVVVSRLMPDPLNLLIKAQSSAGKNWLASRVFKLFRKNAVKLISSVSAKAWNYSKDDFRHRVVYLQERNKSIGEIHPVRLLISEKHVTHIVTAWKNGVLTTEKHVTNGPIACISTTTNSQLEVDDETRHLSIWIDESEEQTQRILMAYGRTSRSLSHEERAVWRMIDRLLEERSKVIEIRIPRWFEKLAIRVCSRDIRARRHYPYFVEACRTVALIRSFQRKLALGPTFVRFSDFAATAIIFNDIFSANIHHENPTVDQTRRTVERLSNGHGNGISAKQFSRALSISLHRAYRNLRTAQSLGVIRRINTPQKGNKKLFGPIAQPRFIPEPTEIFRELGGTCKKIELVHPITGLPLVFER